MGAIALGWLLAQGIVDFVGIFSAPVASWVSQNTYREITQKATTGWAGFPFQLALPELVRTVLLVLIWYALFHWLYLRSFKRNLTEPAPNTEPLDSGD